MFDKLSILYGISVSLFHFSGKSYYWNQISFLFSTIDLYSLQKDKKKFRGKQFERKQQEYVCPCAISIKGKHCSVEIRSRTLENWRH